MCKFASMFASRTCDCQPLDRNAGHLKFIDKLHMMPAYLVRRSVDSQQQSFAEVRTGCKQSMQPPYIAEASFTVQSRCIWYVCRHIVEFKGVGCVEPHTPETMASSLFIVQEFMSGNTLKASSLPEASGNLLSS